MRNPVDSSLHGAQCSIGFQHVAVQRCQFCCVPVSTNVNYIGCHQCNPQVTQLPTLTDRQLTGTFAQLPIFARFQSVHLPRCDSVKLIDEFILLEFKKQWWCNIIIHRRRRSRHRRRRRRHLIDRRKRRPRLRRNSRQWRHDANSGSIVIHIEIFIFVCLFVYTPLNYLLLNSWSWLKQWISIQITIR